MCRYLDHAKRMAGKLYLIAKKLNEPILMSQCCIHMAYSLIHEGSTRCTTHSGKAAAVLQNNELKAIVSSAKHYLGKIKHESIKRDTGEKVNKIAAQRIAKR